MDKRRLFAYWMILFLCMTVMYGYLIRQNIDTSLVFEKIDLNNMDITMTQFASGLFLTYSLFLIYRLANKERRISK